MKRRKFIRSGALAGIGACTGLYTWQVEPFWLEFVFQKIDIPNLPQNLIGKTMMQISDLHIGERFPVSYIYDSLVKASTFHPDYVIYTGDYITYKSDQQLVELKKAIPKFVQGKLGTIAILGNHDYGVNWSNDRIANQITEELTRAGIMVLRNEKTSIEGLNLIGLDDYWGLNFTPKNVIGDIDPKQANIVLSHNPDTADLDIWGQYNSWIFSGHTHGGQCKPPFLPPPMLPVKNKNYSRGIYYLSNNRKMYINRALGHLWQVRFNVRPEITLFELG